jgi:outer membrane protein OmpA-like peptidoglycan-associated protein
MRTILAVSLLAATSAFAQDQAPAQGNPPQQSQTQQQAASPAQQPAAASAAQEQPGTAQQQPAAPAQEQPSSTQQQQTTPEPVPATLQPAQPPAPAEPAATPSAPKQQPAIARTNLTQAFNGPNPSEIYCAGFISRQTVRPSATIVAGERAPNQTEYVDREYIYLSGSGVEEGREYLLLRRTQDPNKYQSYPGQLGTLNRLGELYQDLGRAKVVQVRKKLGVALIESSCGSALPGDIAVPFQERPRPEFKQTVFDQFAPPNGKTTGRIVMGKDLDTLLGYRRVVYLNVGEAQGVKPGDYFRITRNYRSVMDDPVESLPFNAPAYDDTQKDPSKFNFRTQANELPRRSVGELMVLNTSTNSATALLTYAPEDVHLGDGVEMIDATPFPVVPPEAAAAPEPPTISCSVSRSTIQVGETTNVTCNGVAEEGHTVSYSYQASAGQITPRDSRATLTATAPGQVAITATATDDRNLTAQTQVNVDVQAAPVAPGTPPIPSMLNELVFTPNSSRVDNRAKAILDDDALRLQRDANATLILEGSSNPSENEAMATQRAENAKTYLTKSKGIDATRIQTRTAPTRNGATVGVIMVPAGTPPQ